MAEYEKVSQTACIKQPNNNNTKLWASESLYGFANVYLFNMFQYTRPQFL